MKAIPNYENYLIDGQGNIYSTLTNKYIKACKRKDGYLLVGLYKNGTRTNFQVHRLVALTYIPNPNNYPQINHIDENKENNSIENLEWCTAQYNLTYGDRITKAMSKRKENDPNGLSYAQSMETRRKSNPNNECFKQTIKTRTEKGCVNAERRILQYDMDGNLVGQYVSIAEAARQTKCSKGCICRCAKGNKPSHKGFIWKYAENK